MYTVAQKIKSKVVEDDEIGITKQGFGESVKKRKN